MKKYKKALKIYAKKLQKIGGECALVLFRNPQHLFVLLRYVRWLQNVTASLQLFYVKSHVWQCTIVVSLHDILQTV